MLGCLCKALHLHGLQPLLLQPRAGGANIHRQKPWSGFLMMHCCMLCSKPSGQVPHSAMWFHKDVECRGTPSCGVPRHLLSE